MLKMFYFSHVGSCYKDVFYLNQKYDEKIEVGNSSELLEHILWDEVPKRVLQTKQTTNKT